MEEKLGIGEFKEQGPVKVGTAFYDRGRCLPWAMETPCVVCEEVCPVSPKAISTYDEVITRLDGKKVTLNKPFIIPERCIGCGICEKECPVLDERAVYVTAVGETRFRNQSDRRLLLNDKEQKASIFNIDDTGRVQLNSSILSTPNVSSLKPRVPTANTPDNKRLSLSHMIMTLGALAQKSGCGSCSSGGCSSGGCGSSNKQIKPAPASSCGSAATSNSSCASKSSCGSKSSTSNSCCSNKSESKTRAPKALSTDENFNLVTWVRQLNNNQSPKSPRS
jgi:ferredoxin